MALRKPGIQPSRAGTSVPTAPFVRWGRDQLIRKTKKLIDDIIRAYRGDFSFLYIFDSTPPSQTYSVLSQDYLWLNLKSYTAADGVEVPATLWIGKGPILTEGVLSLPRNASDYVYISEQTSGEQILKATRQGALDYLIECNIDGSLKELEHTTGSQDKVDTHAADTSTHGRTIIDGVTERDAAITVHGADTSTHGVSKVADDAGIGCKAWNSGNVSIADVTNVVIPLDSEEYDTDTIHDLSTNTSRLTCKTAGVYIVTATVVFASNATGFRQIMLWKNGAWNQSEASHKAAAASGAATEITISALVDLAVNDYMEVYAYQNSGAALNVTNYLHFPHLSMQRISG